MAGFPRQEDLAKAAKLAKMSVSRAEKAETQRPSTGSTRKLINALRARVLFDESWLVYGIGNPPNTAAPDAIDQYLQTDFGKSTPDEVVRRLRLIPWDVLGFSSPSPEEVHDMRNLIARNLR